MTTAITKDPADVIDVCGDHSRQMTLDDDTITASAWRIPTDDDPTSLQISSIHAATFDDTTATVWVEGGTTGVRYDVINTITTAADRTWERTIPVRVYEQ